MQVKSITKKSVDISAWYNDVIERAKLAEHGPVRGTQIIRPYGYSIWESMQQILDAKIKQLDVENCYFPIFIPYSFLKKEQHHVEGFSPELAIVTHGGGEELAEPVVVRPTSETIMYDSFSRWIESFRDLPLKINQWANVVRWEKRTYFFIRSSEFLWQEGHTAHATASEAAEMTEQAMDMYVDFLQNNLALFGYRGRKSESEKFAGADKTLTYECLMPDGRVVQSCTSHDLGTNFAKVFDVMYSSATGTREYVHQTSWGLSTRAMGALILMHGDDNGLILPPKIAPIQVIVIPILKKDAPNEKISEFAATIKKALIEQNIKVKLDDSDQSTGWKFNQADLLGIPLRIEVGAAETENQRFKVVRRDDKSSYEVDLPGIRQIQDLLDDIQSTLFEKSKSHTLANTSNVNDFQEFKTIMSNQRGFISAFWCEDPICEDKIKQETKASTRCLIDQEQLTGSCIYCQKPSEHRWLFAQSY